MLSVDAWVLLQITQHAVETFSTAVNVLNSRIGLIYFITTDVEFHAFFVKKKYVEATKFVWMIIFKFKVNEVRD